MTGIKASSACLFFLFASGVNGQSVQKDAELWSKTGLNKEIVKDLDVSVEYQLRLNNNISRLKQSLAEISMSYKINKIFQVKGNYRFIQSINPREFSIGHRYNFDIQGRYKRKPVEIQFRSRYQVTYRDLYKAENRTFPEKYNRNKLNIGFDLDSRFEPYVSAETYHRLNNNSPLLMLDKYRFFMGSDYKLTKRHKLGIFYMLEQEINVRRPEQAHVFALEYSYKID